jgi:hypothetical protein
VPDTEWHRGHAIACSKINALRKLEGVANTRGSILVVMKSANTPEEFDTKALLPDRDILEVKDIQRRAGFELAGIWLTAIGYPDDWPEFVVAEIAHGDA